MKEKPGTCPVIAKSSNANCGSDCQSDDDCDGLKKCCFNGCGNQCTFSQGNAIPKEAVALFPGVAPASSPAVAIPNGNAFSTDLQQGPPIAAPGPGPVPALVPATSKFFAQIG